MPTLFERIVPVEARLLHEGVFDPHILKAIFFAGPPGAGKSFANEAMFSGIKDVSVSRFGLKLMDIDANYKALAKQGGGRQVRGGSDKEREQYWAYHTDPEAAERALFTSPHTAWLHNRAWEVFETQRKHFKKGKLGLIIDGTGRNPNNIKKMRDPLIADGYDTSMILVVVPLKVAIERNKRRKRSVPEDMVRKAHAEVEAARPIYRSWFGKRYVEINNDNVRGSDARREVQAEFEKVARRLLEMPLKNSKGIAWIKQQLAGAPDHLQKKVWRGVGLTMPTTSAVDSLAQVGKGRKAPTRAKRVKRARPAQHAGRLRTTTRVGWGGLPG